MKTWAKQAAWAWRGAGWRAPAAAAALLLVAAALVEHGWTEPLRQRVERLEAHRHDGTPPALADGSASRQALAAVDGRLGRMSSLPQHLGRLHQVAQAHGIALTQGQYKLEREADSRVLQYQIVLPVRGSYVKLRRFIGAAVEAMPGAALDHVSFERRRVDDDAVDAELRFVLFLLDDDTRP